MFDAADDNVEFEQVGVELEHSDPRYELMSDTIDPDALNTGRSDVRARHDPRSLRDRLATLVVQSVDRAWAADRDMAAPMRIERVETIFIGLS